MTETATATDVMFFLWMGTLNATKLAAEESFLSEAHRFAMTAHEEQKKLFARSVSPREKRRKERIDRDQLASISFARYANQQKRETA